MMLAMEDKTKIEKVIAYSQGLTQVNIDAILEKWMEAKKFFLEAWGSPIVEIGKMCFDLNEKEKIERIHQFSFQAYELYDNEALSDFIDWATPQEIFNNKIERTYYLYNDEKIPAGTKFVKAFKYFVGDEEELRKIQDICSTLIQENKISGTLVMSVHPLDFLSASENCHNWRSCHALDGDYRSGNLSYLLDKSTIICYLKADGEYKLPHFPEDVLWNSKKWRMWLYLADEHNALFAGRQYPFFNEHALEIIKVHFLDITKISERPGWSDWYNDRITQFPSGNGYRDLNGVHVALGREIYKLKNLVTDYCPEPLYFNDILSSSCYVPYYCWQHRGILAREEPRYHFSIGSEVPCSCCGIHSIVETDQMTCDDCEVKYGTRDNHNIRTCSFCEERALFRNMIYFENHGWTCPKCVATHGRKCDNCQELEYADDLIYDEKNDQYLCAWCNKNKDATKTLDEDWDLPF